MRRASGTVSLAGLAAVLVLLAACAIPPAPVYERDGVRYGETAGLFRQQWWNYYERGASYARGGYRADAMRDFQAALALRDDDCRQARTYGMHYVDYFPNRELGVVRLADGDYRGAERLLERSLQFAPSERAHYFLDQARRQRLQEERSDRFEPTLEIQSPGVMENLTRDLHVHVAGTATDDTFVAAVTVDGRSFPFAPSRPRVVFHRNVDLHEGENRILVRAEDLVGRMVEREVRVVADYHGPEITIVDVAPEGDGLRVAGFVSDRSGIAALTVGDHAVEWQGEAFQAHISRAEPPAVVATDNAGNTSRGSIAVPPLDAEARRETLWAAATTGPPPAPARTSDIPPHIDLYGWEEVSEVTTDRIYLQGTATDDRVVAHLSLNGEPLLRHPGRQVMFGQILALALGDNLFTVRAADDGGHVVERQLTITRRPAAGHGIGDRLRLTCLPLHTADAASAPFAHATDTSLYAVLTARRRFQIVERAALEAVLREHHLSAAGLTDARVPVHLGRLLASEVVANGVVVPFREGFESTVWLVNTATGTIFGTADGFIPAHDLAASQGLAEALALGMERVLPLVEGRVTDHDGRWVMTDLGEPTRVQPEMTIWVFEPGPEVRHPTTGELLGRDGHIVADAVIDRVLPAASRASLVDAERRPQVHNGQRVVTK